MDAVAETVYRALLHRPDADAVELATTLNWPRERIRTGLDDLDRLGLLRPSYDDPTSKRPVLPEIALEALLLRYELELQRRQHEVDTGRMAMRLLIAEANRHRPPPGDQRVEELPGLDAARDGLDRLLHDSRDEVKILAPHGAVTALASPSPLVAWMLRRGVHMRTVYLNSARKDPATAGHARWLTENGAQVRTVPTIRTQILVIDRLVAVVPRDPVDPSAGMCVLRGNSVVAPANALFDQHWEDSAAWSATPADDQPAVSHQESALLRMLSAGDTDERAARKMGVSARTVGRMAADLMDRLGARSRFQAGALAVERGWIRETEGPGGTGCAGATNAPPTDRTP